MKTISEREALKQFDDYLDSLGDVTIGGLSYSQSFAFKEVDEIAYRCAFSDWLDSENLELED